MQRNYDKSVLEVKTKEEQLKNLKLELERLKQQTLNESLIEDMSSFCKRDPSDKSEFMKSELGQKSFLSGKTQDGDNQLQREILNKTMQGIGAMFTKYKKKFDDEKDKGTAFSDIQT